MESYISHRLMTAGYQGGELFSLPALQKLYKASRGIPRLINILSHKAMLASYGKGAQMVTPVHMKMAIRDTEDAQLKPHLRRDLMQGGIWVAVSLVLAALAGMLVQSA